MGRRSRFHPGSVAKLDLAAAIGQPQHVEVPAGAVVPQAVGAAAEPVHRLADVDEVLEELGSEIFVSRIVARELEGHRTRQQDHADSNFALIEKRNLFDALDPVWAARLRRLVVPLARRAGLEDQYAYLERSLERFPTGAQQEELAVAAGFGYARHRLLAGGQMGLLQLVA